MLVFGLIGMAADRAHAGQALAVLFREVEGLQARHRIADDALDPALLKVCEDGTDVLAERLEQSRGYTRWRSGHRW